jgi:hypothetical protein
MRSRTSREVPEWSEDIHIKEHSFWIPEKFQSLSVLYRNVLEGSVVGPLWSHLTEAYVGLKGSVLASWARRTNPLRPSQPAQGETLRECSRGKGEKLAPHSSPWPPALGLGGGAKLAAQPPI